MNFAESSAKSVEKVPNFHSEKARRIKISDIYTPREIQDMKEGHFGILPLVEILKLILMHLTLPASFTFTAPPQPFKVDENTELTITSDVDYVYVGTSETNFAKLKVDELVGIEDIFLTYGEKNFDPNSIYIPNLNKLPRHKGQWLLASGDKGEVNFRMREVVGGDREGNYGIFNLNLNKPEISVHLEKDMTQINLPILIEMASQQVATVLNEESKTPVFKSIRVINPSGKYTFNRRLATGSDCHFRVKKEGKRGYRLQLAFDIDGDKFAVEILATQVPNRAADKMVK